MGYYFLKRADHQRHVLEDKKRVYSELQWAVRKTAQSFYDLRALQLLKAPKSADSSGLQGLFVKLSYLSSIWLADGAVDFFRDLMDMDEESKTSDSPAKLRKAFEIIKERMLLELQHHSVKQADNLGRYTQEIQRIKLSKPIQDSLNRVFELFTQMSKNTGASGLLALSGLSSLDTGEEMPTWLKDMQDAISKLTTALNDDLAGK